jgi:hypothetical protein
MSIRITSSVPGFRRAGMAHSAGPVTHPDGTFSDAQLAQLQAEPRLVVEIMDDVAQSDNTSSTAGQPQKGGLDNDLLAELVTHIEGLDRENAELWTKDGLPKASSFPKGISADEREAAWSAFTEQLDGAD